jgi:hypothetical protein
MAIAIGHSDGELSEIAGSMVMDGATAEAGRVRSIIVRFPSIWPIPFWQAPWA